MVLEILEVIIGTGGLLITYSNTINNNGNIVANGITALKIDEPGGSSGGGTVNIFYRDSYINNGLIEAKKGETTIGRLLKGGAGGNGSVSVGQLLNGTYTSTYTNY